MLSIYRTVHEPRNASEILETDKTLLVYLHFPYTLPTTPEHKFDY